MSKQKTVYKVFRVCLPVTFPPFEGSPRAGAVEYVYRGDVNNQQAGCKNKQKNAKNNFFIIFAHIQKTRNL